MSIELPKYTISTHEKPPGKIKGILVPLAVIISLIAGYMSKGYFSHNIIKTLQQRNTVLEESISTNADIISQQKTDISLLQIENKVKKEAAIQLQKSFKDQVVLLNTQNSEIKFYEKLLSPDTEKKGLRVFQTQLQKIDESNYMLKTTLVQKIERAREISGKYEISIIGKENSKAKSIDLKTNKENVFKFKYFYNITLVFSLPEGFKPEQLVVRLYPKIKKAKTIEHVVRWQSIMK